MEAKAVLFDLDDTLYEYAPCNRHGLAAAREVLGGAFEIPAQEFHALHDEVRGQLASELRGQAASHNRALFFKRMVEAVAGGPHPAAADLVRRMYDRYWAAFYERMQPQADAPEVLAALKASRPLVLVSNHTALPQLGKIAALGFDGLFDAVVTSEEAGAEKPAARIFETALERAGCPAEEAVMIGDDPETDIAGAAAFGMRTIQTLEFTSKEASPRADRVVRSLAEVLSILE